MKNLLIILAMLSMIFIHSCNTVTEDNTPIQIENLIDNNTFYYDSYEMFEVTDSGDIVFIGGSVQNGTLYISETMIKINNGGRESFYQVKSMEYDAINDVYLFETVHGTEFTFDTYMKTLTLDEGEGGIIFNINSTIKSNW